jgi:hypothetical protein
MRAQKQLVFYRSILEVLKESGWPFCRFLKEYQAVQFQHRSEHEIRRLCKTCVISRSWTGRDGARWDALPSSLYRSAGYIPEEDVC